MKQATQPSGTPTPADVKDLCLIQSTNPADHARILAVKPECKLVQQVHLGMSLPSNRTRSGCFYDLAEQARQRWRVAISPLDQMGFNPWTMFNVPRFDAALQEVRSIIALREAPELAHVSAVLVDDTCWTYGTRAELGAPGYPEFLRWAQDRFTRFDGAWSLLGTGPEVWSNAWGPHESPFYAPTTGYKGENFWTTTPIGGRHGRGWDRVLAFLTPAMEYLSRRPAREGGFVFVYAPETIPTQASDDPITNQLLAAVLACRILECWANQHGGPDVYWMCMGLRQWPLPGFTSSGDGFFGIRRAHKFAEEDVREIHVEGTSALGITYANDETYFLTTDGDGVVSFERR